MKILALAAAASLSLSSTVTMAQMACPPNAVLNGGGACECAPGFTLGEGLQCVQPQADVVVAVDPGETAVTSGLLGDIPPAAAAAGVAAIVAGVALGLALSDDDDSTSTTTTTTE